MGKRSSFPRRKMDSYATPAPAVLPVLPLLRAEGIRRFAEPCCGDGDLVRHLEAAGLQCTFADDLRFGFDAMSIRGWWFADCDAIVSNPPWTRQLLHPMIEHFMNLAPTWLLFDSDWCHTKQSADFMPFCSHIVSIGRVKWIEKSKHTGKDNAAWYRFDAGHQGKTEFIGRPSNLVEKIDMGVAA